MRLFALAALVIAVTAVTAAIAAPGDLEARAYAALAPEAAEDWGAGFAIELGTLPTEWPVIGNRLVFADVVYLENATAIGGSVSIAPAPLDAGVRLFAVGWLGARRGGNWCVGLSYVGATW